MPRCPPLPRSAPPVRRPPPASMWRAPWPLRHAASSPARPHTQPAPQARLPRLDPSDDTCVRTAPRPYGSTLVCAPKPVSAVVDVVHVSASNSLPPRSPAKRTMRRLPRRAVTRRHGRHGGESVSQTRGPSGPERTTVGAFSKVPSTMVSGLNSARTYPDTVPSLPSAGASYWETSRRKRGTSPPEPPGSTSCAARRSVHEPG